MYVLTFTPASAGVIHRTAIVGYSAVQITPEWLTSLPEPSRQLLASTPDSIISEDERDTALRALRGGANGIPDPHRGYGATLRRLATWTTTAASADAIATALATAIADREKKEAAEAAEAATRVADRIAALTTFFASDQEGDMPYILTWDGIPRELVERYTVATTQREARRKDRERAGRRASFAGYVASLTPEEAALPEVISASESVDPGEDYGQTPRRIATRAVTSFRERVAKEEIEAWIAAHGSPRLRRLVAEGIEHRNVYTTERMAFERPGWRFAGTTPGEEKPIRNATEKSLDLLDEARKIAPDCYLAWWVEPCDTDEDGESIEGTDWKGAVCLDTFLGEEIVYGYRR